MLLTSFMGHKILTDGQSEKYCLISIKICTHIYEWQRQKVNRVEHSARRSIGHFGDSKGIKYTSDTVNGTAPLCRERDSKASVE